MKILTIDIGTGTQDIFLYDSLLNIENGYKFVLPSPTMMVRQKIKESTRQQKDIVLVGNIMGGGPCSWAAKKHLEEGNRVYATTEAAKTFDDELEIVADMGITIISDEEAQTLPSKIQRIYMQDFNFHQIENVFTPFGISLSDLQAVAISVFDHGNAPSGISDRKFRFEYIDQRIRECNHLSGFAYTAENIPPTLTRMRSVVNSARDLNLSLVVMDSAPAAILGATYDPFYKKTKNKVIANIGNAHTLAFKISGTTIEGVFEHHTGMLDQNSFDTLLEGLITGTLTNEQVYKDHGHGAVILNSSLTNMTDVDLLVTGPRRNLIKASRFQPHFAVPFGDMMLAGCFGLLSATADLIPELADPIRASLDEKLNTTIAPWDVD